MHISENTNFKYKNNKLHWKTEYVPSRKHRANQNNSVTSMYDALLAICARNSPVIGEFTAQRPVTRSFDVFFDLRLSKRLSKQPWGWCFETLSRLSWRHCNDRQIIQYPLGTCICVSDDICMGSVRWGCLLSRFTRKSKSSSFHHNMLHFLKRPLHFPHCMRYYLVIGRAIKRPGSIREQYFATYASKLPIHIFLPRWTIYTQASFL